MPSQTASHLAIGDAAPDFSVPTTDGSLASLAQQKGKKVVLFFYPKDNTPGCTKEACGFRDAYAAIQAKGAVVWGVSPDSVASHRKFTQKHLLPFPLLADEELQVVKAYGVWGEKTFMGRKFMGTQRTTFLIGESGSILRIWTKVKPETHAAEVLASLS